MDAAYRYLLCDKCKKPKNKDAAANGLICRVDLECFDEPIDDARTVLEKVGAVWHAQNHVLVFRRLI